MEVSEKDILAYFERSGGRPLKVRDLARALAVRRRDVPALRALVRELEETGKLGRGPNRRYASPRGPGVVVGRLQGVRAGFAFIVREHGPDIYVSRENLGSAMHGDTVMARLRKHRGRIEGVVERVVAPARPLVAGTLERDASGWFLVPDEERIAREVKLSGSSIQPQAEQRGHKALVRVVGASRDADLLGDLVTILGPADQPGVRTRALLAEFALPEQFEPALLATLRDVRPPAPHDLEAREDLSHLDAFTIDPIDARDHDDAVSIVRLTGGGFELGVHIADVAAYVLPDTLVDQEAERRGTSVYLADRVVPMLPEILSSHVCSLRPGVPRLVLSARMRFDGQGRLGDGRLAATWIASRAKLSYQAAEALLAGREPAADHYATHSSEESGETAWSGARPWVAVRPAIAAALADMRHLARLLRARRMAAGSLDIDTPEFKVMHDARGRVVRIEEREALESYSIIEEFMLMANQLVAGSLAAARLPLLWRVHEPPDEAKAEELRQFLKKLGIVWSPASPPENADYQQLLRVVDRRPERKYLMFRVLRSLQKAQYDARQQEHFGLAFRAYTHFTSPIRRYPDLYNHRLVHRLIGRPLRGDADGLRAADALHDLGAHTSRRELVAAEVERASLKLKVCEYLVDRVGDTAAGFISSVTDHGLYVDVPEWNAEGLVHVAQMTDDDYRPDVQRTRLVGERSRRSFRFGQPVRVQLVRADPDRRQIDLVLVP